MPPPNAPPPRSVLTIGSFDGVHAGHQALLRRAREIADRDSRARVTALVFDPSPLSVLRPHSAPTPISTLDQRRRWLLGAGADEAIRLEPTTALLSLTAPAFVSQTAAQYHPIAWVEGPDFRFGRSREGDLTTLKRLGLEHGFEVSTVDPVTVSLDDRSTLPARSTTVRALLAAARIRDAARVLTRPYQLIGTVVPGDRRGRTIGYPTANLDSPCLAPADGVYAGVAHLPTGARLPAAISIGNKPTFGPQPSRTVEAFILNAQAPGAPWAPLAGLPEYGWILTLDFISFLRHQIAFDSLQPLIDQIERDCEHVAATITADHSQPPLTSQSTTHHRLPRQEIGA